MFHLTRQALITKIRDHLLSLTDDETSVCAVAAERGIFCRGFQRFTEEELKEKFDWIANRHPTASREELEDLINKYKLGRTQALGYELSCDAQTVDRDTCVGWDEFSDEQLCTFHQEMFGQSAEVVQPGWSGEAAQAAG